MAGYQSHFTGVEGLKVAIKHKCRLKSAKRQNNTSLHSKGFDPCWWFRTSYEVGHTVWFLDMPNKILLQAKSGNLRITYCAERHDGPWTAFQRCFPMRHLWTPRSVVEVHVEPCGKYQRPAAGCVRAVRPAQCWLCLVGYMNGLWAYCLSQLTQLTPMTQFAHSCDSRQQYTLRSSMSSMCQMSPTSQQLNCVNCANCAPGVTLPLCRRTQHVHSMT